MTTSFVEHVHFGNALANETHCFRATNVFLVATTTLGTSECGPQTDAIKGHRLPSFSLQKQGNYLLSKLHDEVLYFSQVTIFSFAYTTTNDLGESTLK
jgi:hypothetical protein